MRFVSSFGAACAWLLLSGTAAAQALPDVRPETYPAVSREPIATALAEARAHPDDVDRVGRLGMVLQAWQQWEAAAAVYARARAADRRFDWFYLGGLVAARTAHHAEAAALLRQAIEISPGSTPARLALADALLASGALAEAEREYTRALADPLARPHAHYGLGRILAARGDHAGAIAAFTEALRLYPEFGAAWYALGISQRNRKNVEEAVRSLSQAQQYGARWPGVDDPVLDRVAALRADAAARIARGLQLERQGDIPGAIDEHEAALAVDADATQAHVNLIRLYGRAGDWTRAEAHYHDAVRLGPAGSDALYNYAVVLLLQNRDAEAAAAFQQAIVLSPLHVGALSGLGQIAERAGRLAEALERYQAARDAAPSDTGVRFNVGRMLIAAQRYRDAIVQFEILASEPGPEQARYLFGLATAWVLSGEIGKGRRLALDARALAAARGQVELVASIDRELTRLPGPPGEGR